MAEEKKGFNNVDLSETEQLAHQTMHLSHVLRFGEGKAEKRANPGVRRTLEIASNKPGIPTEKLQGILKVNDEVFTELTGRMTEHGLATFTDGARLTEKGEKVYAEIKAQDKEVADKLYGVLSDEEQAQLKAINEKLIQAWHQA